jgi:hypothetical protein
MIDAKTQHQNLEDIVSLYLDRSPARQAAELLRFHRDKPQAPLAQLLRDHKTRSVTDKDEVDKRDAFDLLLAFYCILEIGILIRYVPDSLTPALVDDATKNLSEPAVRKYYENFYPLLLPQILRKRLKQEIALYEPDLKDYKAIYQMFGEFLILVNHVRNDETMQTFLWFLDDGYSEGYGINDTIEAVKRPQEFMDRLIKPPSECNALERSLHGLKAFISFCIKLDKLLQKATEYPLFQSAGWHYFAYWFERVGDKVDKGTNEALRQFLSWPQKGEVTSPEKSKEKDYLIGEVGSYVKQVDSVMKRLVRGKYGLALKTAMSAPTTSQS